MEKTLKSQIPIKILTTANSNDLNKSSVVLIKANQIDTEKLAGLAEKANAKIHALVNYSGASDVLNLLQNLSNQGFVEGSYVFINIEDVGNINEIQSIYSNLRQGGYYVGLVNTVKGFANLNKDDIKNISFYKMVDQNGDNSITVGDADGYINGLNIDLTGNLNQQPITRSERNTYTNVDVSTDSKGWVGIGQDTVLGGGKGFGYSTMGNDFNTVISPKGIIFRRPDAERMWELLKPKQQAEVSELLDHTVADEIKSATADLPNVRKQADKAVKFAESAIAASKVNSDAIVAQSSAVVEAKSAMDSATAEIQQLKANAASDVAQIESTIAEVQAGVNQAKSANESAVQAVQAELKSTSDAMDKVEKRLNEVGTDLDTYAKSAAEQGHDITLIKQKQGRFEADFASAQGNVNQIQADIKGLRQNIKDNQGNIATLLTSADKLQASMKDAQNNISNLLLTASKYEQTFKDQDGRLSKVEQTATEHTSELADTKGNLDKVTQKADNLQLLLSDAQKNINSIKVDASGIHEALTGQGKQITTINATLDGLNTKYEGVSDDLSKLSGTVATNSTQIDQNKKSIALKADQATVDNLSGEVSRNTAQLKVQAYQISSKVSSEDFSALDNKVDSAIAQIQKNSTAIDQTNQKISLKADQTEVDKIKNTATQNSSRIDVMAGQISSKVTATDVNNIVDGKGYATTSIVQSLITQKAGTINESITNLDAKYNTTVTQVQSLTASIDGLQSNVTNFKNDTSSQITQLSNAIQSKVSASDFNDLKDKTTWKSTDSIDLNTAVSQQKIFVKGGSNLPPGSYWWYVQVEAGYDSRIVQYAVSDRDNIHYSRQYDGSKWSAWSQGATESEITQLRDDINLRVKSGDLLSQINLTAHNTLIQSNKIYLDSSSTVFSGRAFIPSAAIASLNADKVNTGWLNTNNVNLGDGRTRIIADHDYMYIQPTGSAASNTGIRMGYSGLDFLTNVIPNGYSSSVPYYSVGYDGAANGYFKISAFDHINPGGTTATQNWFTMYDAISLNNKEVNIAANNKPRIRVTDNGIEVRPTIFFNNENYSGTWVGFTRLDNKDVVEFNTGNNDGENFHVNSGARFMKYVYFNDYCRALGWLTYSTLSKKTNIKKLDTSLALDKIRQDDQYLYEYKRNVAKGVYDPQASFIIDDVNDVSHYSVPREFIDQTGKYREPSVELSYLIAAFQEIDKQVQKQKEEIKELKEKLQHE